MKKIDAKKILSDSKYDPTIDVPDEIPILIINGKIIGTCQNIVTLQAKQKAGKTTYLTAIIAAALSRLTIFSITARLPEGKRRVAYFDIEQGRSDFYKTIKRIKSLGCMTNYPSNFDAHNLREYGPAQIIAALHQYCNDTPDCGLMVIDPATDILESFNDEAESKMKIQYLKTWSKKSNNLIVQTIHTGRSNENSLGHYGAFSDRASQSILQVQKEENNSITLMSKYQRSDADFDPVSVMYNNEKHEWEETIYMPEGQNSNRIARKLPQEYDIPDNRTKLSYIFNSQPVCDHKFLVKGITEMYALPLQLAKESISWFLAEKLFYKTDEGYTMQQQGKFFKT